MVPSCLAMASPVVADRARVIVELVVVAAAFAASAVPPVIVGVIMDGTAKESLDRLPEAVDGVDGRPSEGGRKNILEDEEEGFAAAGRLSDALVCRVKGSLSARKRLAGSLNRGDEGEADGEGKSDA